MLTQSKKLNFEGQNIYVGIDVHLKSWNVTILSDQMHLKTFNQIPSPEKLSNYLNSNYPKAVYKSAYEAGFCGYWAHRRLMDLGIENIIVMYQTPITWTKKSNWLSYSRIINWG